ncbi:MAG: DNA mismatch repair protein MutS [Fimbriimonadaceae bacterium]
MSARTPMLQQYFRIKAEQPGVILAMRVGDFYEFYGEDAEIAAAALEITLTGRDDGPGNRVAMAGVPYHSVEKYLARLVQKGLKVAICDQLEDTKLAKGLVKRGITRVLTPGTVMEDTILTSGSNNFLAAICVQDGKAGLAVLDPSTGEFLVTEIAGDDLQERLLQELGRIRPSELLVGPDMDGYSQVAQQGLGSSVLNREVLTTERAARKLLQQFEVKNLQGYGIEDKPSAQVAASMILGYAEQNHLSLGHVQGLSSYSVDGFMRLDIATRKSLELTENMSDRSRKFTLLSILDECKTPMGSRLLRRWIEQPLLSKEDISKRYDAVERFITQGIVRGDLRDALKKVQDIERLVGRAATGLSGPRDLAALRNTLHALPELEEPLRKVGLGRIQELREQMNDHRDLGLMLDRAIVADPPHSVREGGIFREGFDIELDKLRSLGRDGKSYIAALEARERERTGINTLKVGFNSVFGYYLEVSKAHLDKVPEDYIRKQTTANTERFITAELKDHESAVLGAEEKSLHLEADLFNRLRTRVAEQSQPLLKTARALAEVDALASLAEVAALRGYTKPEIVEEDIIELKDARHPIVEANSMRFVPNDTHLGDTRVMILTGPNMSGKSTFLRQTALIVLMAQIGSFVPAKACRIGLCDRIFARIGAKDELALGQSTFMVEMVESANILNHATAQSLVILDEVGRGTSTYDGLAIAWAMVEHLAEVGAKTMFATHYHQLNALSDQMPAVSNFRVAVEETGDEIVWTHRVLPGGTDRSYGIHVARMAGVPPSVLGRAAVILGDLERKTEAPVAVQTERLQLTLFEAEEPEMVKALKEVDVNRLTPLEALMLVSEWQKRL